MGTKSTNREGLTLREWVDAARAYDANAPTGNATRTERIAWRMGVDPTEWRTPLARIRQRRTVEVGA